MKPRIQVPGPLLGALLALLIAGCGQKSAPDHSQSGRGRSEDESSRAQAPQGTVDGGGGAGYKGQPLERFRRDIQTLPEFALVAPLLESVRRVDEKHFKIFMHIVRDRLWLFLNEPVPKISEARQGVPFTIDQWAVQNSKEIWISDQYQRAGETRAKAEILLHEILVGLKIMRFLSYNEYCYQWTSNRALCDGDVESNRVLLPEHRLSDLDHADVRKMGEWLWRNHAQMTAAEFGHQMHVCQFQSPHYGWKPYGADLLETRKVNPVIERLPERAHELFTGWGPDRVAREKCVIQFTLERENRRVQTMVRVRDLSSGKWIRTIQYDLAYDPNVDINTALRSGNHGRTLSWSAEEAKAPGKNDDKVDFASMEMNNLSLVEFFAGERLNGYGDSAGLKGIYCDENPVALPAQYELWQELRDEERELLERQLYGGKTLRQLLREVHARPEFARKTY